MTSTSRHALLAIRTVTLAAALWGCGGSGPARQVAEPPAPPVITLQPRDSAVVEGAAAVFVVEATGATAYQWQRSTDGGATWSDLGGATAPGYTTPATTVADGGARYRAVVTGAGGQVTSAAAALAVSPAASLAIQTPSPLPSATDGEAYSFTLAASGGTPPYTWSAAPGTLPPGLALDASSGTLSGTMAGVAGYLVTVQVTDGAAPPRTAQAGLELFVQELCDHGFGFLAATNAPPTVMGRFCPTVVQPLSTPDVADRVTIAWQEVFTYGNGSYSEGLGVTFYRASGVVDSIGYHLNDPTRSFTWACSPLAFAPPPCTGVTADPFTRVLTFTSGILGENGTELNPIGFTGTLRYLP